MPLTLWKIGPSTSRHLGLPRLHWLETSATRSLPQLHGLRTSATTEVATGRRGFEQDRRQRGEACDAAEDDRQPGPRHAGGSALADEEVRRAQPLERAED